MRMILVKVEVLDLCWVLLNDRREVVGRGSFVMNARRV